MTTLTEQILSGNVSMLKPFDTKTVDELLTRDWFVDEDDIYDLICWVDEEACEFIYTNRHKYSRRIREIIEPSDYQIPIENLRIKVRTLSYKEWHNMIRENQLKNEAAFEKHWAEYVDSISDRPLGEVDSCLDGAWERIAKAKEKLSKYLAVRPKSYIPPSMRGKEIVDPNQTLIENEIRRMENEYAKVLKKVEQADSEYWKTKKNDYHKKWLSKLSS